MLRIVLPLDVDKINSSNDILRIKDRLRKRDLPVLPQCHCYYLHL